MADALGKLLGSFDNFKDDAVEYGITGAAAVGANIGFDMAWNKVVPMLPFAVPAWAKPVAALLLAGVAGRYAGKFDKRVGTGVAVGLALAAVRDGVKLAGYGAYLSGLSGYGLGYGAPTTVESINGAPTTVEELNGVSEVPVGSGSFRGGGSRSSLAATFS